MAGPSSANVQLSPQEAGMADLPIETIVQILDSAAGTNNRRRVLLRLLVVCKAFSGPASLLLHRCVTLRTAEQAEGFRRSLQRAPSPTRLASTTRRLSLVYRVDLLPSEHTVTSRLALPVLYLLNNLHHLELDAGGEGFKLVRQALNNGGGGMKQLRTLRLNSRVRWDKLVEMTGRSEKLIRLELTELFHAEPDGEEAVADGGDIERDENGVEVIDITSSNGSAPPSPILEASAQCAEAPEDGATPLYPTFVRPPSPALAAPTSLPGFPSLPLKHLSLSAPNIHDDLLLSMIAATRGTLSSLTLSCATCFSRTALVLTLKGLPNLTSLELDNCTFHFLETPVPIAPPFSSFTPLPSLVMASNVVPLPAAFSMPSAVIAISPDELSHPLDHLARYTPFLHSLALGSDDLLSFDGGGRAGPALAKLMGHLPLQCLTLDVTRPRLGVDEVVEGVRRAEGRLEAVAIGKRTRWTAGMLAEGKEKCTGMGVLLSGEAVESAEGGAQ
ncbi:hypothetical protein JCM10207_005363 [Rhodosporidiobolus poonsookiae]